MFNIGDFVVYGRSGICEVIDVTTMKMSGVPVDKLYYVLRPYKDKNGKISTPVDNDKIVIRAVISKDEAKELLNQMAEISELEIPNEKMREAMYKESIRSCECMNLIKLIKTIRIRKQERLAIGKKITATDERYVKMAESSLYSEFSMVLGIPEQEIGEYITNYM